MIEHLVTSGCSFSDNHGIRWPHALASALKVKLYNRGQGSCGNDWISKTAIYQTQLLLDQGVSPETILVAVMWSGIDRKSLFISANETSQFKNLLNFDGHPNPVQFIGADPNQDVPMSMYSGYMVGSMNCNFENSAITRFKEECILKFFPDEALAIESYEHFLRLQWYCKSVGVKLVNHTFMNIMHYPHRGNPNHPLTIESYKTIQPLHNMIDFSNWVFWKKGDGLYEYTQDHELPFYHDGLHPRPEAHEYYVNNFLMPELKKYIQ